jgi:hypothetical protein
MGTASEAFTRFEEEIRAIPNTELIGKNRSITAILGETSELVVTSNDDFDTFAEIPRFNTDLIELLPFRLDAFMYCYTQFEEIALEGSDAKKEWKEIEPRAYIVKKRLLRRLRMLAEERDDLIEKVELIKIAKGQGRRDLTLDFMQLSEKVKQQHDGLISIGYTESDLAEVETIYETLKRLLGSVQRPKKEVEDAQTLMEQAYTFLMLAVNPIKAYGQMIFEDTEREQLYISQELSNNRKENSNTTPSGENVE